MREGRITHRCARDRVGSSRAPNPRAEDINARRENINQRPKVRERRPRIRGIDRADRDGARLGRRRVVPRVVVGVPGGHDHGYALADGRLHGGVHGRGEAAAEGHGEDGSRAGVVGDPLDAADDAGVGPGARGVEDFDADDFYGFRYAVGAAADGAAAVCAVSVFVCVLGVVSLVVWGRKGRRTAEPVMKLAPIEARPPNWLCAVYTPVSTT
jgi:hypothetical protein